MQFISAKQIKYYLSKIKWTASKTDTAVVKSPVAVESISERISSMDPFWSKYWKITLSDSLAYLIKVFKPKKEIGFRIMSLACKPL